MNLFRYPVCTEHAKSIGYGGKVLGPYFRPPSISNVTVKLCTLVGHSSHVMCVRWSVGDEYLISVGGNDKCVMHWRHDMADLQASATANMRQKITSAAAASAGVHESVVDEADDSHHADTAAHADAGSSLLLGGPTGGDQAGAVKPWVGAVRAPAKPPLIDASAPHAELRLRWVHGYSTNSVGKFRATGNMGYACDGSPVFPAAALGIKLNRSLATPGSPPTRQQYFKGHDDDVLCLAVSHCRRFVATGQTPSHASKGFGSVCVWDVSQNENTCKLLYRVDGLLQRGVAVLSFSPDDNQLVGGSLDDNCTHYLWVRMFIL